ncbi:MAG: thiamine pyrophosphate-dependent dehydrogenase E1 component subunit alpha, partial [Reyranella sp.]|nr:thiamine pyrophosphate-dependent dehydrogenase E1 component subunit alpha [Reyranella sp.]
RYKEHVGVGDDFHFGYRSADDIDEWKARDPLILDRKLVEELTPEIEREIAAAVEFAEHSPVPGRAELLTDVI